MLALGPLSFAIPWALAALATLPILWWLLRLTPPAPRRMGFPPVRLLLALMSREESSAKTPWWLLVLRLALAVVIILAAAHPLFNAGPGLGGGGPLFLIIDDGWASARDWPGRQLMLANLIDQAEREDRPVVIVTTAPSEAPSGQPAPPSPRVRMLVPAEARVVLEALQPKPWSVDRQAAIAPLLDPNVFPDDNPGHVVWLSNGLAGAGDEDLANGLGRLGEVTVVGDPAPRLPTILRPPLAEGAELLLVAARAAPGAPESWVRALSEDGTVLARTALEYDQGGTRAEGRLALPSELRNSLARLELEREHTAAGLVLIDERWRRRPVGLVSGQGASGEQPLLGDLYFVERALDPYTELRRGTITDLLRRQLAVLVLVDPGPLEAVEVQAIGRWLEEGGLVIRFAGPRLVDDLPGLEPDPLLPVKLRGGDRALGGAMSWGQPATLAAFDEESPFFGLEVPADVTVRRQVLAQPSVDLARKTWAQLSDGTPLVSADRRGRGWLILVHTTANAEWSNLPLSGLFVDMLRRLVGLSQGVAARATSAPLPPLETVDGYGRLVPPPPGALAIAGDAFEDTAPGPDHPPGYYGDDTARRALNLSAGLSDPEPMGPLSRGISRETYEGVREIDLRPWLLTVALLLALIDTVVSLALRRFARLPVGAAVAMAVMMAGSSAGAQTGDVFPLAASLETRLAYVITGNAETDETSRAGLWGLGVYLNRRTAAELGEPIGVFPGIDDLSFFPLLYWPVLADMPELPSLAVAELNAYLRNGGTIFFDTRDQYGGSGGEALGRMVDILDVPPLMPIPEDHVLRRSFYLLDDLPGRWTGGTLWVERAGERVNDGVSSIIVGAHDWAAAWAMDDAQRPLFAVVPGGPRQRELAFRFGINLVMYTLTGNYKTDQVHLPEILRRLQQ